MGDFLEDRSRIQIRNLGVREVNEALRRLSEGIISVWRNFKLSGYDELTSAPVPLEDYLLVYDFSEGKNKKILAANVPPFVGVLAWSTQNISVGGGGGLPTLTMNTVVYDTNGFHPGTGSTSSLFTVPAGLAGRYFVRAQVRWAAVAAVTYRTMLLEKNSAGTHADANVFGEFKGFTYSDNVPYIFQVTGVIDLKVGDTVECFMDAGASTNAITTSGGTTLYYGEPYMEMHRIGA